MYEHIHTYMKTKRNMYKIMDSNLQKYTKAMQINVYITN